MRLSLLRAVLPCFGTATAPDAATAPRGMDGYCRLIEADVVSQANAVRAAESAFTTADADRRNSEPSKLAPLGERLSHLRDALERQETEWKRLGCAQILYGRAPQPLHGG